MYHISYSHLTIFSQVFLLLPFQLPEPPKEPEPEKAAPQPPVSPSAHKGAPHSGMPPTTLPGHINPYPSAGSNPAQLGFESFTSSKYSFFLNRSDKIASHLLAGVRLAKGSRLFKVLQVSTETPNIRKV